MQAEINFTKGALPQNLADFVELYAGFGHLVVLVEAICYHFSQ